MNSSLIIKFGGDTLASSERIALAARRIARRLERSPVIAVVSALVHALHAVLFSSGSGAEIISSPEPPVSRRAYVGY